MNPNERWPASDDAGYLVQLASGLTVRTAQRAARCCGTSPAFRSRKSLTTAPHGTALRGTSVVGIPIGLTPSLAA